MKKILLFASALAGLFLAGSCQKETLEPAAQGGVTYEITLPDGPQTKGENGYATYDLHYEVYKTADANALATTPLLFEKTVTMTGNTTTVTLDLLNDQDYTVLFWANKQGENYFDLTDLRQVGVKQAASNNDDRDAFCGMDQLVQHDGAQSKTVELKRPFAQINIATLVPTVAEIGYDVTPLSSRVKVKNIPVKYNVFTGEPVGDAVEVDYTVNLIPEGKLTVNTTDYKKIAMNYALVPATQDNSATVEVDYEINTVNGTVKNSIPNVPVKKNYRTNIIGNLLTSNATYTIELKPGFEEGEYTVENGGNTSVKVMNNAEFTEAFANENMDVIVLGADINLNELMTRADAADPTFTVAAAKTLTIDLGGHKLSATSAQSGKNYDMFLVKGNLTVMNGTIEYEHKGENMGWGSMTCIFDVTAGGVLNLEGVTAKNLGGSDMGFVAHLNNWGEVTLNAENCTLESNYVPVRVFNSGNDMNNVTIKNSTLKGVSAAFWVHNYTVEDFGSEAKAEAQKALLNLNIYNQGNEFTPDLNGVRYGFTNSVRSDAYGITKTVSEDGTEVTLGSVVENGLIRRGVAGAEENTTITKVVVEEGVATLYDRTFRRFYALETVELPNGLTTIGATGSGVFQSCTALKNIVIPETVNVLGKGTFQECSSLESINIPAGVTRIEADALRATGLVSVEFHEGVTYFGAQAFRDCKQLKEVVIKAPKFTVEANAFGVMSGALPGTTIYVANAEMKAYLESTLAYKNQFTIVAPNSVSNAEGLTEALANGENVVMTQDITTEAATTAPYGNKYAFKLDGGVLDGNGHELHMECYGDDYGIMTSGGTIKNLTIKEGCRAVMIMYPQQDVILDNVNIGGNGVLYPINTGEAGAEGVNLVVTNSVLAGWTSFGLIESASFTNVEFKQGTYYNNIYGRVLKPYVNTTLTNCAFVEHMNLDLSSLTAGHKVIMTNCTVNGQAVTADVFTVPTTDSQYDTELFTIDLPSWASSINDCVVFN